MKRSKPLVLILMVILCSLLSSCSAKDTSDNVAPNTVNSNNGTSENPMGEVLNNDEIDPNRYRISPNEVSYKLYDIVNAPTDTSIKWDTITDYEETSNDFTESEITDISYLKFSGLPNKDAETKLNSDLKEQAYRVYNDLIETPEERAFTNYLCTMEVKICNSEIISVYYHVSWSGPYASRTWYHGTINVNPKTGELYKLSDFFAIDENFAVIVLNYGESTSDDAAFENYPQRYSGEAKAMQNADDKEFSTYYSFYTKEGLGIVNNPYALEPPIVEITYKELAQYITK